MSLVCFPCKREKIDVVLRNVYCAATHPDVTIVLIAAARHNGCHSALVNALDNKQHSPTPYPVPVRVILQEKLGVLRSGKGDGMNSALNFFLTAHKHPQNELSAPLKRIHFYDADIESFDQNWITRAEEGIAQGYEVVRHYFPRSSTDAQVTWQITRVGFALLWPHTILPWIHQPLGGELCFTRPVVEALVDDTRVINQSNWGIDTLYTFVCAQRGFSLLEAYIPQGKIHGLYSGLRDLKSMACECFAAIQSLKGEHMGQRPSIHRIYPASAVPAYITEKVGYDVEASLKILRENWNDKQYQLLPHFSPQIQSGMRSASKWPEFKFMDEDTWISAYAVFLQHFELSNEDWKEVFFKMWVARVLNYTMRHVIRGYSRALDANTEMVMKLCMKRSIDQAGHGSVGMSSVDSLFNASYDNGVPESPPSPKRAFLNAPLYPISPITSVENIDTDPALPGARS